MTDDLANYVIGVKLCTSKFELFEIGGTVPMEKPMPVNCMCAYICALLYIVKLAFKSSKFL